MIAYSNPRCFFQTDDWPSGRNRVSCKFEIEDGGKKGERILRSTTKPGTEIGGKPKQSTYSRKCAIVDGSDGKTYCLHLGKGFDIITVMQSNMQYQEESVHKGHDRYNELLSLLQAV